MYVYDNDAKSSGHRLESAAPARTPKLTVDVNMAACARHSDVMRSKNLTL